MCAVYKEKALTEKALLKHLDGKADGKKVAVSEEAVVSEEAGETEDTHPKPEPDAPQGHPARTDMSFFFRGIPGCGTLLFKVKEKVLSPAPHRHTHPHVGGSPTPTLAAARLSLGMVRCVVCRSVCRRRWKASSTPTAWARHTAPTSTSASATTASSPASSISSSEAK